MTELSPVGTITCDDHVESVAALKGTAGKLLPGTEGKIVCPHSGKDLHFTEEGELLLRGPQVMQGLLEQY